MDKTLLHVGTKSAYRIGIESTAIGTEAYQEERAVEILQLVCPLEGFPYTQTQETDNSTGFNNVAVGHSAMLAIVLQLQYSIRLFWFIFYWRW